MSDLPSTAAKVFQYADDIAVTYQAKTFNECENNRSVEPIFSSLVPSIESRKTTG
jgi:hypothetical protein